MKIGPIREWKVSPALTGGAGRGKEKHFFRREAADAVLEKKEQNLNEQMNSCIREVNNQ